ncbi:hypothetical protein NM208_g1233 [Fusarium decemcellulare]|uniref:Uncharacterized protein n=1 Tax=Fusarium decemcellulare TaxID=57161 RepID=A0ACC1SWV2_9HYPO|nr:hypothetical protein NM208_g1233 [Fusarium decemcellulare]
MPSQTLTSVLLSPCDGKLVGDAVGAEAAATKYLVNGCMMHISKSSECNDFYLLIAVGPWASKPFPRGAIEAIGTGEFDFFATDPNDPSPTWPIHREMNKSIAEEYTTSANGPYLEDDVMTETMNVPDELREYRLLAPPPVTITTGPELLKAVHSEPPKAIRTTQVTLEATLENGNGDIKDT